MTQDKLALIRQSLAAAESSVKTAKQLLSELESGGLKPSAKDLPGELGVFDGTNMVTESHEVVQIPANYASKSMLVVGDTLKLVEEDGQKKFKQIEHVKRHKTTGILHKKDGKFKVITPEGSYNVLDASIEHFQGDVGDEAVLQLPAGNLSVSFGAVESIAKKDQPKPVVVPEIEKPKQAPKPEVKKPFKPAPKPTPKPVVAPKPQPKKEAPKEAVSAPLSAPGEDDELR
jgi:hypothetical protein